MASEGEEERLPHAWMGFACFSGAETPAVPWIPSSSCVCISLSLSLYRPFSAASIVEIRTGDRRPSHAKERMDVHTPLMHATRFVGLARVHEPHVMAEHPVIATGVDRLTRNASPHTGGELVHDDAMVRASTTKPCSIGIEYASDEVAVEHVTGERELLHGKSHTAIPLPCFRRRLRLESTNGHKSCSSPPHSSCTH
ncbi:hypothetical protein GW17_00043282, partial [Ensete ventricosum]